MPQYIRLHNYRLNSLTSDYFISQLPVASRKNLNESGFVASCRNLYEILCRFSILLILIEFSISFCFIVSFLSLICSPVMYLFSSAGFSLAYSLLRASLFSFSTCTWDDSNILWYGVLGLSYFFLILLPILVFSISFRTG